MGNGSSYLHITVDDFLNIAGEICYKCVKYKDNIGEITVKQVTYAVRTLWHFIFETTFFT